MKMKQMIVQNLQTRFRAYDDLLDQLDEEALQFKLEVERHKSLAEHLWCVIGSRESYAQALRDGAWQGFSCSMTRHTLNDFADKLTQSGQLVLSTLTAISEWTEAHDRLLADLAEHEVMHEGQIIRHVLGTGSTLPSSWKWA